MAIVFTACNPSLNNEVKEISEFTISITSSMNSGEVQLSNYVDSITVIPLETTDESLIARASNIVLFQDKIFISDAVAQQLIVFSNTGKHIKTFHKRGQGGGEYISLTNFFITKEYIYILDISNRIILVYNHDFQFINRIKLESPAHNLIIQDNNIWLYNIPGQTYDKDFELTCINTENQTFNLFERKYINGNNIKNITFWIGGNVFHSLNEQSFYSEQYGNKIYKLGKNSPTLYLDLDFGDYTIPETKSIFLQESVLYSADFPYVAKEFFSISSKYNIVRFCNAKGKSNHIFQNKKNGEIQFGTVKNDIIPNYRFIPIFATDNILIEPISAALLFDEDFNGILDFEPSLRNVSEEDNFVLIFYHLKE